MTRARPMGLAGAFGRLHTVGEFPRIGITLRHGSGGVTA
jgi:hypothetical protein